MTQLLSVMMITRGRRWDRWWKVDWSGHLTTNTFLMRFNSAGFPKLPYVVILDGSRVEVVAKRKDGYFVCKPYRAT